MKKSLAARSGVIVAALLAVAAAGAAPPPDEHIKQATERVQTLIKQNAAKYRADQPSFYTMVESEIVPRFDLPYIAQLILARNWRQTTPEQRQRFQVAFKNMLIRSYADALLEYHDGVKAEWLPLRAAPDATDVVVKSNIVREGAPPVPLGFAMRLKDDQWKIYDITIEAVSLVSSFRSQIASEIKKSGIDSVIAQLEKGQSLKPPVTPGASG